MAKYRYRRGLLLFNSSLAVFFLAFDSLTELGVADGVLYITVVLLAYNFPGRRLIIVFAVVGSLFTLTGFFVSPPGGEFWKIGMNRALALYAIWVTAVLLLKRKKAEEAREQIILDLQTARSNIKVLSGLLPICFNCKKIRDDTGYWNRLEDYIASHSEAEFSHGLCQECAKNLYPEYCKD